MDFRLLTTTSRRIRHTAALATLSLATLACGGTGDAAASSQRRSSDAVRASGFAAENHPLDEATVRKVVAVMRAWSPPALAPPKGEDARSVPRVLEYGIRNSFTAVVQRELADRNSTATIDGTPPLKAAIAGQGLSSREFVMALLAFQAARINDDLNASLTAIGAEPAQLPAILKRNIEVIRSAGPKEELPSWW